MEKLYALMVGDVVGEPGLAALEACLPGIIRENSIDFTVVNGENAADGFGMTEASLRRILCAGADVVSSGNHVWEKRDFWPFLDTEERVLRPANYPQGNGDAQTPGRGWIKAQKACTAEASVANAIPASADTLPWLVINLQGRDLMASIDCPFRCFDSILETQGAGTCAGTNLVLVDFHAESTREKEALAYYLDGRASLVAGTHTHVQTSDERVLPKGTGYITDLGMTGNTSSVIGMDPGICLDRVRKQVLYRMEVAESPGQSDESSGNAQDVQVAAIQGVIVEIDRSTGKAVSIRRL
jgi:metallophosphoesterase (TIGR00282 family)